MSAFSVKKPFTIAVIVIIAIVLGMISFFNMSTDLLPEIDLPYVVVMTTYPGAAPEEVETVITKPVEQAMATTSNIKNVSSISAENVSAVILEYYQDANMDSIMLEINSNIDMVKAYWDDSVSSPIVLKINPDMLPVMVSAVSVDGMEKGEIASFVNDTLLPKLESIDGVASVSAEGAITEQYEVVISQDKIDKINDKLLAAVNDELGDAEEQLDDAQAQIDDGKASVASTRSAKTAELNDAKAQIDDGREQIESGYAQLAEGEQLLLAKKAEVQSGLEQIDAGLTQLYAQNDQAKEGIKQLKDTIKTLQSQLALLEQIPSPTPEQLAQMEQLRAQINALSAQYDEAAAGLETLHQSISDLEGKKTEAQAGLAAIEQAIAELPYQKQAIETAEDELNSNAAMLETAQGTLNSELSKASSQLEAGQEELDTQRGEFEDKSKEARESANIDGTITVDMIKNILAAENFSMPAGYVYDGDAQYVVKVGDELSGIDEIENLLLFTIDEGDVGDVRLSDVADINMVDNSGEIYAKLNGSDGVLLSFQKQSTYSTSEVAKSIRETCAALERDNPGLTITHLMDQGVYIDIVINSVLENLLYGAVLAMIVLFFFLRSLKPTIVVAVSIPISVICALALMYFTGVTMNIISLAGLALGVGMLVDNSIVVIENIYRLKAEGMNAARAAVEGAKQVAGAITASTLTTICVFLPIVFVRGISRQLFTDIGLTIAYSLVASLLVAMTLVPAMSSRMLKNTQYKEAKSFGKFVEGYEKALRWALKYKAVVIIGVVAALCASGYFALQQGTVLIPDMDSTQMSVTISVPDGETIETDERRAMVDDISARIMDISDVESVGAMETASSSTTSFMSMGTAAEGDVTMYVILSEDKERSNKEIARDIENSIEDIPLDVSVSTSNIDLSALGGSGVQVEIRGEDYGVMMGIAADIAQILESTEGTENISDGMEETTQEIRISVDKDKAMKYGLTVAQVYQQAAARISEGDEATSVSTESADYPVVVSDGTQPEVTPQIAGRIMITGTVDGEERDVRLDRIAEITQEAAPSQINRDGQERTLTVSADVDADHNIGKVSAAAAEKINAYDAPEGYSIVMLGENETITDTFTDLIYMMLLAVALIYLIMVAQFQSLLSPFIVMFTIPLAFTGGLLAIIITGAEISMVSLLGFLILTGVVVNNGIVFVDFINQMRREGMDKREAIILAGKTRIRPILMTALTTILGLVTLALGIGMGSDMLAPMASVTIGGLSYATALTLFFVPVLYDIFNRKPMKNIEAELEEKNERS